MKTIYYTAAFFVLLVGLFVGWATQASMTADSTQTKVPATTTTGTSQTGTKSGSTGTTSSTTSGSSTTLDPSGTPVKTPAPTGTTTTPSSSGTDTTPPVHTGITAAQLAAHSTTSDCWVGYQGVAYDVTNFLPRHPGGVWAIASYCGTTNEFTNAFISMHGHRQDGRLARSAQNMGALA